MISIVIPTFHRTAMLVDHLSHLQNELIGFDYEVIVVNDAKDQKVHLPSYLSTIRVVDNPKSGVASARNLGASLAKFDWFLFLDDDMKLNRHNFETYLSYLNLSDHKFTVNLDWTYSKETDEALKKTSFGRFLLSISYNNLAGWNNLKQWPVIGRIEHNGLASCNLLIHHTVFQEVGGYDEEFSHAGAEDFEFSQRVHHLNIKTYIDTSSQMIHNELDRLSKSTWFKRKVQAGITNKIAFEKGYKETFIPKSWKFKLPQLNIFLAKSILLVSERVAFLDRISFLSYKLILGQALYSGFYQKKFSF